MNEKLESVNTVANIVQLTINALREIPSEYVTLPPTEEMKEHILAIIAKRTGGYHA